MHTIEPHLVATRYGRMHLLGRDSIVSESLALYGEWAQREIDFLAHFIAPDATVLDIGAFIGTHTLAFSTLVGEQGTVIAFEPRAEAFGLLSRNVQDNQRTNVRLHQRGVSDAPATITLHRLAPGALTNFAGLALEDDDAGAASGPAYEVPLVTVDSLALSAVGLLKIDVEGMERQVLDGARETIATFQPAVFAEANSISAGLKILDWCQASGYECLGHLTDAFNPGNFNGETRNIFDDGKELNLLLLPSGRAIPPGAPRVFPIDNADDIAALLLHKPQYPHEVLSLANRTEGPGLSYPSPAAVEARQRLENEVSDLQSEIQAAGVAQLAQATALQATAEAARRQADALQAQLAEASTTSERVNRQLASTASELEQTNERLDELKAQHETALAALTALRESRSWRFTAPLRSASRRLRAVLNRFKPR
ncbi:FkbM family methyltransferase [Variovorax sp. LT1R20]|uniref:FkbM family methyltransferase n=1 Tax=Variovorax sp. LT1R20 TaxID=3443729 RepID=UPI003F48AB0B